MTYRIEHIGTRFHVTKRGVIIASFATIEEAADYVQGCVEDARWNAANRD